MLLSLISQIRLQVVQAQEPRVPSRLLPVLFEPREREAPLAGLDLSANAAPGDGEGPVGGAEFHQDQGEMPVSFHLGEEALLVGVDLVEGERRSVGLLAFDGDPRCAFDGNSARDSSEARNRESPYGVAHACRWAPGSPRRR